MLTNPKPIDRNAINPKHIDIFSEGAYGGPLTIDPELTPEGHYCIRDNTGKEVAHVLRNPEYEKEVGRPRTMEEMALWNARRMAAGTEFIRLAETLRAELLRVAEIHGVRDPREAEAVGDKLGGNVDSRVLETADVVLQLGNPLPKS